MRDGVEPDPRARVVDSTRTHEGPLLKIDLARVELPNGTVAELETIRHPGAAAALPFLTENRVLLIQQYRHAMGGIIWEVPAGKLDDDEAPEVCAEREVAEEVGFRPGRLVPLSAIYTTPGFTDEVIWLYEAHDLEEVGLGHEADEVIDPVEVDFEEAVAMVRDGRIQDGKSVATILQSLARRLS